MPRKKDRAELQQPDQFVTFWSRVVTALANNRRPLTVLLVAILVGLAGIELGSHFFAQRSAERSRAFARIEGIADARLLPAEGEAPKGVTDDDVPHFKTDKERKEAALREVDAFLARYPSSRLKEEAQLLKARYLVDVGRASEAVPLYASLRGSLAPRLEFLVEAGLGAAYEATGELDRAIEAWDAVAKRASDDGDFYRDHALFNKARLLERRGRSKEAQALYKEVVEKFPTTSLRDEINNRLALLDTK